MKFGSMFTGRGAACQIVLLGVIVGWGAMSSQGFASGNGVVESVPVENPDPACDDILTGAITSFAVIPEFGELYASGRTGFYTTGGGNECGPSSTDGVFRLEPGAMGPTFYAVSDDYLLGEVNDLIAFEGNLYAGGNFNQKVALAGDGVVGRVAVHDATTDTWAPVANGLGDGCETPCEDRVLTFAVYQDELYAAGHFSATQDGLTPLANIAKWDQENDEWVDVGGGLNATVHDLVVVGGQGCNPGSLLIAVGAFTMADEGGQAIDTYRVAMWNGTNWAPLGPNTDDQEMGGFAGIPYAAAIYDDGTGRTLYIGGSLVVPHPDQEKSLPAIQDSPSIARLSAGRTEWTGLSGGLWSVSSSSTPVDSLYVFDDGSGAALYVGGRFDRAGGNVGAYFYTGDPQYLGIEVNGLARYRNDASGWETASQNPSKPGKSVLAMQAYDDGLGNGLQLYLGGDFNAEPTNTMRHVARLTGDHGQPIDPQTGAPEPRVEVDAVGCGYLKVYPPASSTFYKIGIRDESGATRYLLTPYDDVHGRFADLTDDISAAAELTREEWGCQIFVTGDILAPSTTYDALANVAGDEVVGEAATTWVWGDANHDGTANFADIQLSVQAFQGDFSNVALPAVDIAECVPNGLVNLVDTQAFVIAFQGTSFEDYIDNLCGGGGK